MINLGRCLINKIFIFFQKLLPKFDDVQLPCNDNGLNGLLRYFNKISKNIERLAFVRNKNIAQSAFYDTLGGYLKSRLIPSAKLSFYAGNITLHTVREVLDLYEKCKATLDTKGLGWSKPRLNMANPYAIPLYLDLVDGDCSDLLMLDDEEGESEDEIIALPRLEYDDNRNGLTNIWLPFRRKHVYNLRSKLSAFIFMRYFIAASKCYKTERVSSKDFNQKLERWIRIYVVPHLKDDRLYAGFGGVLRVLRTLKTILNDTEPLMLHVQNLRRHSNFVGLPLKQEDYDYEVVGDERNESNMTMIEVPENEVNKDPLFTKDMAWMTTFSVMGVLLIVLLFVFMKRCVTKQQKDMRNIPLADPPSFQDTSRSMLARSRSERNSKSYLARKQLPITSSASSMAPRSMKPRGTMISYTAEEKGRSKKGALFKMVSSKTKHTIDVERKSSPFKVTTDSESEEEIFDLKHFIEKKDLTTEANALQTIQNETNPSTVNQKRSKQDPKHEVPSTKPKPPITYDLYS